MELIIKGFIIGLGKIIPGVSGAMLAISLGVYEEILEKIANIKKQSKSSAKYLIKPLIGIILAIIITSKIIVKCLNMYYLPTMLLFVGLIASGIPKLIKNITLKKIKKISTIISIIISIIIIGSIEYTNQVVITSPHKIEYTTIEFIKLIGIGIVDSIASIIPGISGTALLMILGYYNIILTTFGTISKIEVIPQNSFILIPFTIRFILGTIAISKILNKIIKKQKETLNIIVTIFMIYSLIKLAKTAIIPNQKITTYLIGTILFIIGLIIGITINNLEKRIKQDNTNIIK